MRGASRWLLWMVLVLGAARVQAAPTPADDTAKKAREAFTDGTTFFNLGQWDKAIDAWQAGYKLKSDPIFLYNIAQAYRLADNFERALFFYKSYLRNLPKAPNKLEVEQRIEDLQKALDERKKAHEAQPDTPITDTTKTDTPQPTTAPTTQTTTAQTTPAAQPEAGTAVVATAPPRPKQKRADLSVSGGLDLWALGAGGIHATGGFAVSGGYDVLVRDRFAVRVGAKVGYSFLSDTGSTVHFISLLADPEVRFRLWKDKLFAFVELGVGAMILTGLDTGSEMLVARAQPSGAFAAFELRPAVGIEYRIIPAFALFLTPTLIYSPSPHQYFADSTLLRFDVQLGGEVRF